MTEKLQENFIWFSTPDQYLYFKYGCTACVSLKTGGTFYNLQYYGKYEHSTYTILPKELVMP